MPTKPRSVAISAGALGVLAVLAAGCPTVDLGENPPEAAICRPSTVYFQDTLWPQYIATGNPATSCVDQAGCHAQDDGRSALRLSTQVPIDFDGNYAVVTRFLNCGVPEQSAMFTKPVSGVEVHGGGDLFGSGDAAATVFLEWFNQ